MITPDSRGRGDIIEAEYDDDLYVENPPCACFNCASRMMEFLSNSLLDISYSSNFYGTHRQFIDKDNASYEWC